MSALEIIRKFISNFNHDKKRHIKPLFSEVSKDFFQMNEQEMKKIH